MSRVFTDPLLRFRVLAYATGVFLLVGCAVLLAGLVVDVDRSISRTVWTVHGWLYLAYVLCTLALALARRWGLLRVVLVALAGTVPAMSFVAERHVVSKERSGQYAAG